MQVDLENQFQQLCFHSAVQALVDGGRDEVLVGGQTIGTDDELVDDGATGQASLPPLDRVLSAVTCGQGRIVDIEPDRLGQGWRFLRDKGGRRVGFPFIMT